ncbi:unnamed protein product [Oikopleura dioica]|uniref:SCP2 domain-containing protein n=1 Tax=Oikopleura dioica TaxID=34765 RepID=E4XML9_OIKDI|nr:unnamed protein product [Oikopleura dioica]
MVFRFNLIARPVLRTLQVRPLTVSVRNLLESDKVFAKMGDRINEETVAKVKGVFRFDIVEGKRKVVKSWTADLKNGEGSLVEGEGARPDCTIVLSDEVLCKLAAGELNAQSAFFAGKLKIKGNLMMAQKLTAII